MNVALQNVNQEHLLITPRYPRKCYSIVEYFPLWFLGAAGFRRGARWCPRLNLFFWRFRICCMNWHQSIIFMPMIIHDKTDIKSITPQVEVFVYITGWILLWLVGDNRALNNRSFIVVRSRPTHEFLFEDYMPITVAQTVPCISARALQILQRLCLISLSLSNCFGTCSIHNGSNVFNGPSTTLFCASFI